MPLTQVIGNFIEGKQNVLAGAGISERVDFTYATLSPLTLKNLIANDQIVKVLLVLTEAFDAPSTLNIGTVANPTAIFENIPANKACKWLFHFSLDTPISEVLRLIINPGASTQGAGYVLFEVRNG
jgi:hypothetical protein